MMKDLFSGSLGRLNNHGGSRIYTTPNTILVPPEYEIDIGEHGDFVTCSLDGRLWMFKDKIVALKWDQEIGKMEYATTRSFNSPNFIARGRDWILTSTHIIQYFEESPYIIVESHGIESLQPMEEFYSLLPPIQGFQIIKGYLIRKPGSDYKNLVYPVSNENIFLTFHNSEIWGKGSTNVGIVTISDEFEFEINTIYTISDANITGIVFLYDGLYGFQIDLQSKGLCYSSQNLNLYSFESDAWSMLSDETGKIYFDPFNKKGLALHEKGMEILPERNIVECKALEQWIAPKKEFHNISDDIIISAFKKTALVTNINSGFYRSLLQNKELSMTRNVYDSYGLSLGVINQNIEINTLLVQKIDFEINLLNIQENTMGYALCKLFFDNDKERYSYDSTEVYLAYGDVNNPAEAYYIMTEDVELTTNRTKEFDPYFIEDMRFHNINFKFEYEEGWGNRIVILFRKGETYTGTQLSSINSYIHELYKDWFEDWHDASSYVSTKYHYYLINPTTGSITDYYSIVDEGDDYYWHSSCYLTVYNNYINAVLDRWGNKIMVNSTQIDWKTPSNETENIINFFNRFENIFYFQCKDVIKRIKIDDKYNQLLEKYTKVLRTQTFANTNINNEFINVIFCSKEQYSDFEYIKYLVLIFRTKIKE